MWILHPTRLSRQNQAAAMKKTYSKRKTSTCRWLISRSAVCLYAVNSTLSVCWLCCFVIDLGITERQSMRTARQLTPEQIDSKQHKEETAELHHWSRHWNAPPHPTARDRKTGVSATRFTPERNVLWFTPNDQLATWHFSRVSRQKLRDKIRKALACDCLQNDETTRKFFLPYF